jgi:hypothetical protein
MSESQTDSMPTSLKVADLHEAYHGASAADCIAMANLGAICWSTFKDGLYDQWAQSMTAEEAAQAAAYRDEGRQEGRAAMLETMRARLAAAEEVTCRLATAEGTVAQLRASVEAEAARRVSEALEGFRKDYELTKMKEMTALHQRIAAAEARDEMLVLVREGQAVMKEKLAALEEERAVLQAQLLEATVAKTKSSHAIGKQGEMTVLDMLRNEVLPQFLYSSVEDMSAVGHAADFHVRLMSPVGKRVKILVDSKKYKTPVKTAEITKLSSDVDGDEEANAALLISLDSPIFTAKQFQLEKSTKGKAMMYVTLQHISPEMHGSMIAWAIRILSTISSEEKVADQQHLIDNVLVFLRELEQSFKDIDATLKAAMKTVDLARGARDSLQRRVSEFRIGTLKERNEDEDVETVAKADAERCTGTNAQGKRCGRKPAPGSSTCRVHGGGAGSGEITHLA